MIEPARGTDVWTRRGRVAVLAIAVITAVTGVIQILAPGTVLDLLSAAPSQAGEQGFATIGMFMVLFAGLVIHSMTTHTGERLVLLWASFQKLGACAAVGLGVERDVFAPVALLVAGFDLASGVLMLWYRSRLDDAS